MCACLAILCLQTCFTAVPRSTKLIDVEEYVKGLRSRCALQVWNISASPEDGRWGQPGSLHSYPASHNTGHSHARGIHGSTIGLSRFLYMPLTGSCDQMRPCTTDMCFDVIAIPFSCPPFPPHCSSPPNFPPYQTIKKVPITSKSRGRNLLYSISHGPPEADL